MVLVAVDLDDEAAVGPVEVDLEALDGVVDEGAAADQLHH